MIDPFIPSGMDEHGPSMYGLSLWAGRFPLTAGITGRERGFSSPPYHSLNCGLHVNDDEDDVLANRIRLVKAIQYPFSSWTCGEQVHGVEVAVVAKEDKGRGRERLEDAIPGVDALITKERGILLTALFADCVPLYFYDQRLRVIGLAHAGWRGTIGGIAERTVQSMQTVYGSEPENIRAAVGPSIGICCYEVDRSVMEQVWRLLDEPDGGSAAETVQLEDDGELKPAPKKPVYTRAGDGKFMLDLKELNRQIMIKAGILPGNMEISSRCTSCSSDLFFSHRKEKGRTGRMAAWIALR